jgi:hypothetical protein
MYVHVFILMLLLVCSSVHLRVKSFRSYGSNIDFRRGVGAVWVSLAEALFLFFKFDSPFLTFFSD